MKLTIISNAKIEDDLKSINGTFLRMMTLIEFYQSKRGDMHSVVIYADTKKNFNLSESRVSTGVDIQIKKASGRNILEDIKDSDEVILYPGLRFIPLMKKIGKFSLDVYDTWFINDVFDNYFSWVKMKNLFTIFIRRSKVILVADQYQQLFYADLLKIPADRIIIVDHQFYNGKFVNLIYDEKSNKTCSSIRQIAVEKRMTPIFAVGPCFPWYDFNKTIRLLNDVVGNGRFFPVLVAVDKKYIEQLAHKEHLIELPRLEYSDLRNLYRNNIFISFISNPIEDILSYRFRNIEPLANNGYIIGNSRKCELYSKKNYIFFDYTNCQEVAELEFIDGGIHLSKNKNAKGKTAEPGVESVYGGNEGFPFKSHAVIALSVLRSLFKKR